jgi:anti-sigma B factor antagonist
MEIEVHPSDVPGVVVISIQGEITSLAATTLRQILARHMSSRDDVIVDLTQVTFVDANGLSVLVRAERQIRERGRRMAVVVDHARVVDRPRLDALTARFGLHRTVESARLALADFSGGSAGTAE